MKLNELYILHHKFIKKAGFTQKISPKNIAKAYIAEYGELLQNNDDWKWWAKGKKDEENTRIELADGLIFLATLPFICLNQTEKYFDILGQIHKEATNPKTTNMNESKVVEKIIGQINRLSDREDPTPFMNKYKRLLILHYTLCRLNGCNPEEINRIALGKVVLNFFRQKHGYAKGTYQKIWNGKEDNFYMLEFIRSSRDISARELLQYLEKNYTAYTGSLRKA